MRRWEQHAAGGHAPAAPRGEVVCFSGCDDDQPSADQSQLSEGTSTGAMTFALIAAAEEGHTTIKAVIDDVYDTLGHGKGRAGGAGGAVAAGGAIAVGAALVAGFSALSGGNTRQLTHKLKKFQRRFNQMMGGNRTSSSATHQQYASAMQMYMGFLGGAAGGGGPRFTQEPQISSNVHLDLNSRFSL